MREEDFYQIFITGTGDYLNNLLSKGLGGVIFFSKDIQTAEGFKTIIKDIKNKALYPPFLAIDQEGGRVERTEFIHPRHLPAKIAYEKGVLKTQTQEMADELKDFGINLNFSPVVDVNTNPDNPVIGDRAFGNNPSDVIKGAKTVADVYKEKGIITCAKHFPGHGDTHTDSHKTLPVVELSLNEMEEIHIAPFEEMINYGVPMVMIAHLNCKCFGDFGVPASLSIAAINYLRKNLGFDGVIITDDMNMGGVAGLTPFDAALKAIQAGVDILLYRASDRETYDVISELKEFCFKDKRLCSCIETSIKRIKRLKSLYNLV